MEELNKTFTEYCESFFGEYVSDLYVNLKKSSQEYQDLINEREKILNHFPNLRDIFENRKAMELTEDEVAGLVNIININDDIRYLQEKELFLKGMKESCKILRELEMIKD